MKVFNIAPGHTARILGLNTSFAIAVMGIDRMNIQKSVKLLSLLSLLLLGSVFAVFIAVLFEARVNLTVPTLPGIRVFEIDGAGILNGTDISDLFEYNGTAWNLKVIVKNVGNLPIIMGVEPSSLPPGWIFKYSGSETLQIGSMATVDFLVWPNSTLAGTQSGPFSIKFLWSSVGSESYSTSTNLSMTTATSTIVYTSFSTNSAGSTTATCTSSLEKTTSTATLLSTTTMP